MRTSAKQASLAEQTYGIEPHEVPTLDRGVRGTEEIFFGVAFSSGLDKVVIPFIDRGIPIEYELVRSICTVAGQQRKTLGVLKTDAQLFGGFSMQGPTEESEIITELKKQYDVFEVDPAKPITKKFDVLMAVQPSSLSPEAMENFVQCIKSGQPTAIFEDPMPWLNSFGGVVGTGQPKQPPGGMMGMFGGQPPGAKGDISQLWKLLGVEFDAEHDHLARLQSRDQVPRHPEGMDLHRRRAHRPERGRSVQSARSHFRGHAAGAVPGGRLLAEGQVVQAEVHRAGPHRSQHGQHQLPRL